VSGLPAALWLLGLFIAAPALRAGERYDFADRLRDALIVGVAIPFGLGFVHALYAATCWGALALCVAIAYVRRRRESATAVRRPRSGTPYVTIGALVAVAWPQLMRPLLDGDSLSYHLPNAAAWVQTHSLWTTATHYWWYPPASELFGAALYAVSGPFALPWCGFGALALLGFRLATWARDIGAAPLLADALAAATITAYPLAIQGGTMQNDVWLAAFWLECVATLRVGEGAAARALAVTALLKPQGWILAAIAMLAYRARLLLWLTAIGAIGMWLAHNAILRSHTNAVGAAVHGDLLGSTILAHGLPAIALSARVALALSPFATLAFLAALAGPAVAAKDRRLGWAACGAALLFFVLPFGYATSVAQLATGASLRFAAPAIAAGAALLARPARRAGLIATILLFASTLFGIWYVLAIFWNDGGTHIAIPLALLAAAVAIVAQRTRVKWPNAIMLAAGTIVATHLAGRHPLDYYNDSLRVNGTTPGIYRWLVQRRPAAIGGWGVRLGVVNVLSPATVTVDLSDVAPCVQARSAGVALVAVAQSDISASDNAQRLQIARRCGTVLYGDAIGVAAQPP
jgi:hypothetical protein